MGRLNKLCSGAKPGLGSSKDSRNPTVKFWSLLMYVRVGATSGKCDKGWRRRARAEAMTTTPTKAFTANFVDGISKLGNSSADLEPQRSGKLETETGEESKASRDVDCRTRSRIKNFKFLSQKTKSKHMLVDLLLGQPVLQLSRTRGSQVIFGRATYL